MPLLIETSLDKSALVLGKMSPQKLFVSVDVCPMSKSKGPL
jgi:hypothetical protein